MRSAEFDKQSVLRAAMQAFMNKGFTKTSMQDLKAATGLHPGSIYCAFGNKRGLLLAALGQYKADRSDEFAAFFTNVPAVVGLERYLNHVVSECISCDLNKACLLQKALNELAEQDDEVQGMICEQLQSWHSAIEQMIAKAQQEGAISTQQTAAQKAHFMVMGIYGLRTYAHTHPTPETLTELGSTLLTNIIG
jgi:TetR/AcrR family transcriptional repressor of nem operon